MSSKLRRLVRVQEKVNEMPANGSHVENALAQFQATGELPAHNKLAVKTIEAALRKPRPRSIREDLFREAVHPDPAVHLAARFVIKTLVELGRDPTTRGFLDEDMEIPDWGTVGLHLFGFPELLAVPPYEDRVKRTLDRLDDVRTRLRARPGWNWEVYGADARAFRLGRPPTDDLSHEMLLLVNQFYLFVHHLSGADISDAVAAYDALEEASPEEFPEAEQRVIEELRKTIW